MIGMGKRTATTATELMRTCAAFDLHQHGVQLLRRVLLQPERREEDPRFYGEALKTIAPTGDLALVEECVAEVGRRDGETATAPMLLSCLQALGHHMRLADERAGGSGKGQDQFDAAVTRVVTAVSSLPRWDGALTRREIGIVIDAHVRIVATRHRLPPQDHRRDTLFNVFLPSTLDAFASENMLSRRGKDRRQREVVCYTSLAARTGTFAGGWAAWAKLLQQYECFVFANEFRPDTYVGGRRRTESRGQRDVRAVTAVADMLRQHHGPSNVLLVAPVSRQGKINK